MTEPKIVHTFTQTVSKYFTQRDTITGKTVEVDWRIVSWRTANETDYSRYSEGDLNYGYKVAVEKKGQDAMGEPRWADVCFGVPEMDALTEVNTAFDSFVTELMQTMGKKKPTVLFIGGPDYAYRYRVVAKPNLGGKTFRPIVEFATDVDALGQQIWLARADLKSRLIGLAGLSYDWTQGK